MNKTQHRSNNGVLGAPAGWDQAALPVDALPITSTTYDGVDAVVSFWRPTPEEIEKLKNGALVMLSVIGTTMPPVGLGVAWE